MTGSPSQRRRQKKRQRERRKKLATTPGAVRTRRWRAQTEPPTPEVEAKRSALLGSALSRFSAIALDALFVTGCITEHQRDAGLRFAFLFGQITGRTSPAAEAYGDRHVGQDFTDEQLEDMADEYRLARIELARLRRVVVDDFFRIVIDNEIPEFLLPVPPAAEHVPHLHRIRIAFTGILHAVKI